MQRPITLPAFFCFLLLSFLIALPVAQAQLPCDTDTIPPQIVCPADTTVQLGPWECSAVFEFSVMVSDNCDPQPQLVQTDTTGLVSGDLFYMGIYELSFEAQDSSGNSSTCSFSVEIADVDNPLMACRDDLEFFLGPEGYFYFTPDMFLDTAGSFGCLDKYVMDLVANSMLLNDDTLFCDALSLNADFFVAKVTNTESGNSCWSTFFLYDTLPPVFDCPADTVLISCEMSLDEVPPPPVADNCTPVNLQMTEYAYNDDCDSLQLFEHLWVATDTFGNVSSPCSQWIQLYQGALIFPPDILWSCEQVLIYPSLLMPEALHDSIPLMTGADTLDARGITDTAILANTGSGYIEGALGIQCFLTGITYQDTILSGNCENDYTLRRIWTVIDWCHFPDPGSQKIDTQYISVVDDLAPLLTLDTFEVSANILPTDTTPCLSQGYLPPPQVEDCNEYDIRIFTPLGEAEYLNGINGLLGGLIPAPGLELGTYEITYEVEDACGNLSELTAIAQVVDDVAPTAHCPPNLLWVLPNGASDQIPAMQFDSLSEDNCCLDHFEVRRLNGDCYGLEDDFGPEIEVCCSDASTGPVSVVFRAYDCSGNYSECFSTVEVQVLDDNSLPLLTYCPESLTISCDEYLADLATPLELGNEAVLDSLYGTAAFIDNCELNVSYEWSEDINSCTAGEIVRTWTATDSNNVPVVCEQVITVEHVDDYSVIFPPDSTFVCENGQLPDFGEPVILGGECELIGVSYEDVVYQVVPNACYKIVRTWTVLNWCTYPDGLVYTEAQIIKVVDDEPPLVDLGDQMYCIEGAQCATQITLPMPDVTDCSEVSTHVYSGDLAAHATADQFVYVNVPPGTYDMAYTFEDGCGNASFVEFTVGVEDCHPPTAVCAENVSISINASSGFSDVLPAEELDAGSFDNCSGNLLFSFSQDVANDEMIFDCSFLGGSPQQDISIDLWVTDASGNQSTCTTTLTLIDPFSVCELINVLVVGNIHTETGQAVPEAGVLVNGANLNNVFTDNDGTYQTLLIPGQDYTLSPALDVDPLNGVTTLDLVLLTRHILGIALLDSPYKIIAGDVNRSNSISTLDVVELQKLILGIIPDFSNNTSWRFVDAAYVFPDPTNPWAAGGFPESIFLFNLQNDVLDADFIAVKTGDVNNSVMLLTGEEPVDAHAGERFVLQTEEKWLAAGERVVLPFRARASDFAGLQLSLQFDAQALAFEGVVPGLAGEECFSFHRNTSTGNGLIAVSWPEVPARDLEEEVLFTLKFEALRSGRLSDWLNLSAEIASPEAYRSSGERLPMVLSFGLSANANESAQGLNLYANPNPFNGRTALHFYLPATRRDGQTKNIEVKLSITDAQGRLIWQKTGFYEAGYQEEMIEHLDASGLLFCTLESASGVCTVKLISK